MSQPMQASAMLWPTVRRAPSVKSWRPSTRKLSSMTPMMPDSPAATCSTTALATPGWRRKSLPNLIVYFALQRYFIAGLTIGAEKG